MAVIIGRASIKVYPDTKGFRRATIRELKNELRGIERDMAQDKDGGLKVRTSIEVNEQESARNIQRFLNKIKDRTIRVDLDVDPKFEALAEQIDDWRNRPVKVRVDLDADVDDFKSKLDDIRRDFESQRIRVPVDFEPESADARGTRRVAEQQAEEFSESWSDTWERRFSDFARRSRERFRDWSEDVRHYMRMATGDYMNERITVIPTDEVMRDIDEMNRKMERFINDHDGESIDIHPVLDETSLRTTWARIKWLTRDRFTTIHVRVSESSARIARRAMEAIYSASGLRNSVSSLKDLAEWMERLDRNAPALALVSSGIVGIAGAVVGLTGSLAHVINEFARMSGAALALPGILGGFAFGIGTMVAALRDFNREVPKIRDDLGMLQDRISDRFWDKARVPLLDAWNTVLPSLQRGLDRTATSLGSWTARMSEALAGAFDEGTMDKMFGNLAKSIEIASLSAGDFANILAVLGRTGSEYLPRLARWGNDVAKSFSDWLSESEKTGRLNEIMDTGIQKLKEFGKLVREAGEFIYLLGSAAERAGFSGLGEMADGLERVNEQMKTLEGQRSLDDYFEGAARMADGAKSAIGSVVAGLGDFSSTFRHIGGDVQSVLTDLGDAFEDILGNARFQSGVKDLFGGLSDGIRSLADQAGPIGDILGGIASVAGEVVSSIGEIGGKLIEVLGPHITNGLEALAPALDELGEAIGEVLDAVGSDDALNDLFESILELPAVVVYELALALKALAQGIKAVNGTAGESDRGFWKSLVDLLGPPGDLEVGGDWSWGDFWKGVWDDNVESFNKFFNPSKWEGLMGSLRDMIVDATTFSGSELGQDGWLWDMILDFILPGGNINGIFTDFDALIVGPLKEGLANMWDGFTSWLSDLFTFGGSDAGGSSSRFDLAGILPDFDGLVASLQEKIAFAQAWISDLWASFRGWLSGLFSGGGGEGATGSVFNIDLVLNALDNASGVIQSVAAAAVAFASGVYQAALTAINHTGAVIANARAALVAWATARYQATLTALNRVSAGVQAARAQITAWARAKYQAALTAVNRTAAGIASAVGAIVSRVVRGRFVATVRMNPAVQGLSSVVSRIRSAVSSFTARVRTTFSADGNIFDGRGVRTFADGGIASGMDQRIRYMAENHVAQISGPTLRVWAEPETGGEAYIPLADSKRERSTAILGEVARRFGYRLEKYADGSSGGGAYAASDDNINLTLNYIPGDQARTVASDVMWGLKHRKRGGRTRVAR